LIPARLNFPQDRSTTLRPHGIFGVKSHDDHALIKLGMDAAGSAEAHRSSGPSHLLMNQDFPDFSGEASGSPSELSSAGDLLLPDKGLFLARQFIVEELDDMKMVKNNRCFRKMSRYGADISGRHIHDNGFNLRFGSFELFPEGAKCIGSLTVTNKDNVPFGHIQNNGQAPMPLANRNFINGNSPKILQAGPGKSLRQIPFLYFLDHVPGYRQMSSYILNCHVLRQLQGISLKGMGVRKPGISKPQRNLTNSAATKALYTLNIKIEKHIFETDGNASESSPCRSSHYNLPTSTDWTTKFAPFVVYVHFFQLKVRINRMNHNSIIFLFGKFLPEGII